MLNKKETAQFCSQLRMLLASGMPLLEALRVIKSLRKDKKHSRQIDALIDKITEGYSLSESALNFLPALTIGSIRAAERAGNLEETLERLSKYYHDKAELEEKVIGALVYPCFVLILSLISVMVLLVFVLPGLKGLFADLGTELPLFTSAILNFSDFVSRYLFI